MTLSAQQGAQTSSKANSSAKGPSESTATASIFLAPTSWGGVVGGGAAIATNIVDDALVLMKSTKYGKYYEATKLATESFAGIILNEGLEMSKDGEKGGWSDGHLDFAEDVALTVGGNYVGGIVATAILGAAAPALVSAAVGVATAALIGGVYSWVKSELNEPGKDGVRQNLFPPSNFDGNSDGFVSGGRTNGLVYMGNLVGLGPSRQNSHSNSSPGSQAYARQNSAAPAPGGSATGLGGTDQSGQSQDVITERRAHSSSESQEGQITVRNNRDTAQPQQSSQASNSNQSDGPRWEKTDGSHEFEDKDDGNKVKKGGFEREVDKDGNPTGNWRAVDENGSPEGSVVFRDKDSDQDGTPDSQDNDPNDASKMENPEKVTGSSSSAEEHDFLTGFRGDIDYGPDHDGREQRSTQFDGLAGVNPRLDYGQDAKPSHASVIEHDWLTSFDPSIDWGEGREGGHTFTGNKLSEILGGVDPRAAHDHSGNAFVSIISFADPLLA